MNLLLQPVDVLKGVGKQSAQKLNRLGIEQVQDLLFHLPLRYEDRTRIYPINSLHADMSVLICGEISHVEITQSRRTSLVCQLQDDTGLIHLRFFHFSQHQRQQLQTGSIISCFGEVRYGFTGLEIIHPEYQLIKHPAQCRTEQYLSPIYPLTEGLNQATIRKAVLQALQYCQQQPEALTDWLPDTLLTDYQFPSLVQALQDLHTPTLRDNTAALEPMTGPALKRLAFEELLAHHLSLRAIKRECQAIAAPPLTCTPANADRFIQSLPFKLTGAQLRVMAEIAADCAKPHPMLRLVQGDVGSGKTVVSAYAALLAIQSGLQVAVMAPTELLAEQHLISFQNWFADPAIRVIFLSAQIKGKARQLALTSLADGSAAIIIGTHALFQNNVHFQRLGLIIIDEQHRFGVHQRMALRDKALPNGLRPHQLVMTATPIPRTLAMLQYADLDVSIIDELPPGRKPIMTSVIPSERREAVIERIRQWADLKRQAYWVCTLIAESDILESEAAEKTYENLCTALPALNIGLIHGRLKPAEKEAIMAAFKQQQLDLLVATTVIEVGVDVPNASLMIIENPERLGLAQLHQLRGRVGRGADESYCLLIYQPPLSETARQRLGILRESQDGFVIAEKDLALRGPGELLGTRQTGQIAFKIADLVRDTPLLDNIANIGDWVIAQAPQIIPPLIQRWLPNATDYTEV